MQVIPDIQEYNLSLNTVVCPACNSIFATPICTDVPAITRDTVMEADLHIVLPDHTIRATFITMCAACSYTWWTTTFKNHHFHPGVVPKAPEIDPAKKFAHAILTGRHNKYAAQDLVMLALNGYWCAREAGETDTRWLTLIKQELDRLLSAESKTDHSNYHHYVMAEICRQTSDFHSAVRHFDQVKPQLMLPKELIERQRSLAISGDHNPALLPAHLVEEIFCPQTSNLKIAAGA